MHLHMMSSKLLHVLLLVSLSIVVTAKKCRNFCHRDFELAQQDCTKNSFVLENCETTRCRFPPLSGQLGRGWRCSERSSPTAAPTPPPDSPCPPGCFDNRESADALCDPLSPRCGVKRCRTRELGLRLGYQCVDRFPSQGRPTPNPASTPDVTPESGGMDFSMDTFMTGTMSGSMEDIPSTIEGNPRTFNISYSLTINEGGVVSMNGVAESVVNISCFMNATIRIMMNSDMIGGSLEAMYPIGAVLVIDRNIFGECLLEEPGPLADNEEDEQIRAQTDRGAEFRDTYLRIESLSGTPEVAFISGSVTELIGLFSEGEISVVANDPNLVRADLPTTSRMDTFTLTLAQFNLGPLEITTEGSLIDNGGFRVLSARWDSSGVDFQVQLAFELIAQLELKATLKIGVGTAPITLFTLLSVPLYGIPDIPIIDDLVGNFSLPDVKIGVFFEIPFIVRVTAEIEKDLGSQAVARYTTGRKEITFFVTGPYTDLDAGIRLDRDDPAGPSFMFTPMLNGDDPVKINFIVFAGIRPQVILYLPFFEAGVGVEIGVESKGQFALPDMAFPPQMMGGFGVCDTCHLVRVNADGKIQNAGAFAKFQISIPVPILGSITLLRRRFSQNLPGNPTLTTPLANACFVREFGENTEVCGTDCCNTEEEMCMNSGSPPMPMCSGSPSPSPSSSPSQSPSPRPTPTPGRPASCYTDPHLRTFDGLYYDCQGSGEFTMTRSAAASFEVQARFTGSTRGTVTTGVAVASAGIPTVQVSMAINTTTPSDNLASCPVIMYVDGVLRSVTSGSGQDSLVTVSVSQGRNIAIALNTGVSVSFTARDSSSFGCYFERLSIFLPETAIEAGPIVGLLGSPNNNPLDDWMTSTGDPLPLPALRTDILFRLAYEYCTTNWCVTEEENSLFTYEEGSLFSDFNRCDTPYGTPPDFSSASPALQELCGDDSACLVDGLAGNIDDAMIALNVQAQVDTESTLAQEFQFDPPIVVVGADVNVLLTMDFSRRPATENASDVEQFNIFRVNSDTGLAISGVVVELFDNGLAVNSDTEAEDLIFSNILPLRSEMAGERFSFRAIPVVRGVQDDDSLLARTALNGVRSYSRASAIGGTGGDILSIRIESISGLELIVQYSWPMDRRDLDTSTEFSDENVGFSCSGTDSMQYVFFSGDDVSTGGTETVTILLDQARVDGDWTDFTTVVCRAGWFGSVDLGPASLRTVLRDVASGVEIPDTGLALSITPGVQGGCAEMLVATLEVTVGDDGVTLALVPAS